MIRQALVLERHEEIQERRQQRAKRAKAGRAEVPLASLRGEGAEGLSNLAGRLHRWASRHLERLTAPAAPFPPGSAHKYHLGPTGHVLPAGGESSTPSPSLMVSELQRLDEESVLLEAALLMGQARKQQKHEPWWHRLLPGPWPSKGEEAETAPVPSSSYVARLPLQPAMQLLMSTPSVFSFAATAGDARAVARAGGRNLRLNVLGNR